MLLKSNFVFVWRSRAEFFGCCILNFFAAGDLYKTKATAVFSGFSGLILSKKGHKILTSVNSLK